jgi:hypothetical protein
MTNYLLAQVHLKYGPDAPFPDSRFQAGARTFPDLALKFWKEEWSGQSFMVME